MNQAPSTIVFLRVEGLALGLLCVWLYGGLGQPWWIFAVLLLVPDVAILGYLRGPKVGAIAYNIAHSWALAATGYVVVWYLWPDNAFLLSLPLILGAHIGLDRALGYGLKLPTGFKDTHLGRIGKAA